MISRRTQLATKASVRSLRRDFTAMRKDMRTMKRDLASVQEDICVMKRDQIAMRDEIMRHFDVVAEQLRCDVLDAVADGMSLCGDRYKRHDRRITRVETHLGIAA